MTQATIKAAMTSPDMDDEAMKAMARRIAADMPGVNALQRCAFLDGQWDDAPTVQSALAAIIETQERDAALAETAYKGVTSGPRYIAGRFIAKMIRSGQHYGKDHPHA